MPSGTFFYSPNPDDSSAQQLQYAMDNFLVPLRYRGPFHTPSSNTEISMHFDDYNLITLETIDPLGNRTTAGQRDTTPVVSDVD